MDSKEKFSNKVSDYLKYRPQYPKEYINYLVKVKSRKLTGNFEKNRNLEKISR